MNIQPLPSIHRVTAQTTRYERRESFGQTWERHLPHYNWRIEKKSNNVVKK